MTCDCQQWLIQTAMTELENADKAAANKRTKIHEPVLRRRAHALNAAAGELRTRQRNKEHTVSDTITTVTPEIRRAQNGRPYVAQDDGKEVTYARCTTFIKALEDTYNLERWGHRMVAKGLSERPDLLLAVAAASYEDKDQLNDLCDRAKEAAKASAPARTGSALHALAQIVDLGLKLPVLPATAVADLDAYRTKTTGMEWLAIERGVVVDDLKIHGTPDRVIRLPDGEIVIGDIKTGDIEWSESTIAMQLAVYSRGVFYDHVTKTREPLPEGISQDRGLIIHLPAGQARCDLVWVDLEAGWEGVQLATQVRAWRNRKGLTCPYNAGFPDLATQIANAPTVAALTLLWSQNTEGWTQAHTEAAAARKATLAADAA